MRQRVRFLAAVLVVALLGGALGTEIALFARRAEFYLSLPILGDANVYFAMGRGWLHGLAPYRDLFEIKPPLIFLVAALSLGLTGTNALYTWLELGLLALLAPALAACCHAVLERTRGCV